MMSPEVLTERLDSQILLLGARADSYAIRALIIRLHVQAVRLERHKHFSDYSAYNALVRRSFSEDIELLTASPTRLRRSRSGSL
jgi:hypothetical protein